MPLKKLWILLFCVQACSITSKLGQPSPGAGGRISFWHPEDSYNLSHVIEETKELSLAFAPKAYLYNPAIVAYEDAFLLAFRATENMWQSTQSSSIGLFSLDLDFAATGPVQRLQAALVREGKRSQAEDPRLLSLNGELYMLFNDSETDAYFDSRRMYLGRVRKQASGFFLDKVVKLEPRELVQRHVEKNWTPFIYNDRLYVIYSFAPLVLLKVDTESGVCEKVFEDGKNFYHWQNLYGQVRGGSPALAVGQGLYLTFFHSSNEKMLKVSKGTARRKKIYFTGALLFHFDGDSLHFTKITPHPIVGQGWYEDNASMVIFVAGLAKSGEKLVITFGKDDKKMFAAKLDFSVLDEAMIAL